MSDVTTTPPTPIRAEGLGPAPKDANGIPKPRNAFGRRSGKKKETVASSAVASLHSPIGKVMVYSLAFLWTLPTFGILISSFRPEQDVKTSGWWEFFTDPNVTLDNYRAVLSSGSGGDNLGVFFLNSLRITIPSVILSVGLGLVAAYVLSWMNFRGRDWLYVAIVGLLMVPLQMALVPLLQLFTSGANIGGIQVIPDLDLTGTIYGTWIAHTAFGLPLVIFILYNFVAALPKELMEAGRVDGAGHATTFIKLVIPLSVPALASVAIFQFLWIWNDYLIALIFAGRENAPIVRQLATLTGTRGQSYHLLTAAGMVSMIVPVAVFFSLQKYFVRGLLAGSVKG